MQTDSPPMEVMTICVINHNLVIIGMPASNGANMYLMKKNTELWQKENPKLRDIVFQVWPADIRMIKFLEDDEVHAAIKKMVEEAIIEYDHAMQPSEVHG